MAQKVIVSADSTCDLTPELLERYRISVMPLQISLGTDNFRDGIDIHAEDLYSYFERTGELPTTAASSLVDYMEFFKSLKAQGADEIVHYTISSELSSSYQNAALAARELDGVYVVDTRHLSTGIGTQVIHASELADQGLDGRAIFEDAEEYKFRINTSFVLDTLEYMKKGGRCSTMTALGASILKLKPCLFMSEGKLIAGQKYRGSNMPLIFEKYARERLEKAGAVDTHRIFITHSGRVLDESIERVRNVLTSFADFDDIFVTTAGCSVSTHCGPNTLGILFVEKK